MNVLSRTAAMLSCFALAGCATIANPGKHRTITSPAGATRVARVDLRTGTDTRAAMQREPLRVYEGSTLLPLLDGAEAEGNRNLFVAFCRHDYGSSVDCDGMVYSPYVELDRTRPHVLRLVRGREERTVTMKAGIHIQWFWANAVWAVAAPIGWAADLASGRMKYFGSIDVDRLFREPQAAGQ